LYYLHEFCDWDTKRNLEEALDWGDIIPRRLPGSRMNPDFVLDKLAHHIDHGVFDADPDDHTVYIYLPVGDDDREPAGYEIAIYIHDFWIKDPATGTWYPNHYDDLYDEGRITMEKCRHIDGDGIADEWYQHTISVDITGRVDEEVEEWTMRRANRIAQYRGKTCSLNMKRCCLKSTVSKSRINWYKVNLGRPGKKKFPQWLIDRELERKKKKALATYYAKKAGCRMEDVLPQYL